MEQHRIILFDGECNLCNRSVQLIMRNDHKNKFRFASLQSEPGVEQMKKFQLPLEHLSTFVLIEHEHCYTRSTAALRIAKQLDGLWPVLYILIVVPKFLRDMVYDFIAKHRYRLFGKSTTCMVPSPELKSKFLA